MSAGYLATIQMCQQRIVKLEREKEELRLKLITAVVNEEKAHANTKRELAEERALVDGAADIRIVDGLGGIDIDEATAAMMPSLGGTEEEWKLEWRRQFRIALRAAIDAARRAG